MRAVTHFLSPSLPATAAFSLLQHPPDLDLRWLKRCVRLPNYERMCTPHGGTPQSQLALLNRLLTHM
jgi:hypothetical protein